MPRNTSAKQAGADRSVAQCGVCKIATSKYRCSLCPVRYCSVPCYKTHKVAVHPIPIEPQAGSSRLNETSESLQNGGEISISHSDLSSSSLIKEKEVTPLRALTTLSWPPEPDESIYTDPLTKEDPKPLRHSELLRIAQSADLRHLLTSNPLPSILLALDALPTPGARSAMLARCLSIDPISLSAPTSTSANLLSQRDSPPPLEDLIRAVANGGKMENTDTGMGEKAGFWIGREVYAGEKGVQRVWIGDEERKMMRIFAGLVCRAIDGGEGDAWGQGGLAWEV